MYLGSLTLPARGLRQIKFRFVLFCSVLVSILFRLLFQRSNFHNSIISVIRIVNVKCHISRSCGFGNPVSANTIFFIPIFTSIIYIISQKKKKTQKKQHKKKKNDRVLRLSISILFLDSLHNWVQA